MEEWIPEFRLVAPWNEAETLLEDALRMFAALEVSGDVYVTTTYKVVETVFVAIPQEAGAEVSFGPANGTDSGTHRADLDKNTHDPWAARRKLGVLAATEELSDQTRAARPKSSIMVLVTTIAERTAFLLIVWAFSG